MRKGRKATAPFSIGSDSGIDVGRCLVWLTCSFGCQNASLETSALRPPMASILTAPQTWEKWGWHLREPVMSSVVMLNVGGSVACQPFGRSESVVRNQSPNL
jgi:hypothetical protein